MPQSDFSNGFETISRAAAEGALVLTANRRLSRHLIERFDGHQKRQGLEVWPSAQILPFSTWLGQCWQQAMLLLPASATPATPRHLLTESQARVLWERVIGKDRGRDLLQPSAAARLASRARELLKAWRLELPSEAVEASEETAAFMRWRDAFESACGDAGWCTGAELPDLVAGWLEEGVLSAPGRVLLAGFDEITPQQNALLEKLAAAGAEITHVAMNETASEALRVPCRDSEQEMETAARWARQRLEDDPACTIGIVAPDLAAARAGLERNFADVLAPDSILPGASGALPFNISQGDALADFPLVREALFLLGLWRETHSFETITRLLLSPYLAGEEEERGARALLDAHLRQGGEAERPLAALVNAARAREHRGGPSPHHAPLLAGLLEALKGQFDELRGQRQFASAWAVSLNNVLGTLGWPHKLRMDSEERQTWEKLRELFSTLAGLDLVLPRITMGEALSHLNRLAQDTQFQPEGAPARVQILGMLEAGGLSFDHLWVLGLHDEAWPHPPRPNPFLPAAWQRGHHLPQSSATREAEYARRMTARLLGSAPHVVVSYGLREGEIERRPSRLIAALPCSAPESLGLSGGPSYWQVIQQSGELERISDSAAPPLASGAAASGGSSLFQDQAACPFRAFANHRLHARPLENPVHGLDPRERGNIVHAVLERLWAKLESSTMLHALSADGLKSRVIDAVNETLEHFVRRLPGTLRGRFIQLERERLIRLMMEFLEKEKERAPFTVHGREVKSRVVIGGIEVNTRADRIDLLEDGRHIVIDYKTGRTRTEGWMDSRPDEPQLPLYCTSGELDIGAVAFAQLRRGDTRFNGFEAEKGILPQAKRFDTIGSLPGIPQPPSRDTVLAYWKSVLEELALQFRRGEARVNPKKPHETCKYCELVPVCRIHELPPPDNEAGNEEGGESDAS